MNPSTLSLQKLPLPMILYQLWSVADRWQEQYAIAFPPGSGLRDEVRCSNAWNYRFNGLENAY